MGGLRVGFGAGGVVVLCLGWWWLVVGRCGHCRRGHCGVLRGPQCGGMVQLLLLLAVVVLLGDGCRRNGCGVTTKERFLVLVK